MCVEAVKINKKQSYLNHHWNYIDCVTSFLPTITDTKITATILPMVDGER